MPVVGHLGASCCAACLRQLDGAARPRRMEVVEDLTTRDARLDFASTRRKS
jgi:hypothetical protein